MDRVKPPFCVLSIAGSDSGAGAGIQADQRTIACLGGHALTAITAVTAQDTARVLAWEPVGSRLLTAQIRASLGGFPVAAVKTGLLPGAASVRAVARALRASAPVPLVVDPVIGSTSGTRFLDRAGVAALRRDLLPLATVVTPNWPEAAVLSGLPVTTEAEACRAATRIVAAHGCSALVKAGHSGSRRIRDCLCLADGTLVWFEHTRVRTPNTHGTGCVLSAAIAGWLARGAELPQAVGLAVAFLERALKAGRGIRWGGRGPALARMAP